MSKRTAIIAIFVFAALVGGYFILDSILFDGVKPERVDQDGIKGQYYAAASTENSAAVLLVGGGQWGDYWGVELAKNGFVGLSLPYAGVDGLPELPEEIPLEYFEHALTWLGARPEVNPEKIVVMGASRNAELALTIASYFPARVSGVIAYAPSAVSWSNTVLPFNSDTLKASWTYQGADVPYIPMDKLAGGSATTVNTLEYWTNGLHQASNLAQASIKVEQIQGPILLFSGKDDQVWPSAQMADMIEARLSTYNLGHQVQNIQYADAGHLISGEPGVMVEGRVGKMSLSGKPYDYRYGGTSQGDFEAKLDAKRRVLEFVSNM